MFIITFRIFDAKMAFAAKIFIYQLISATRISEYTCRRRSFFSCFRRYQQGASHYSQLNSGSKPCRRRTRLTSVCLQIFPPVRSKVAQLGAPRTARGMEQVQSEGAGGTTAAMAGGNSTRRARGKAWTTQEQFALVEAYVHASTRANCSCCQQ